MSAPLDAATLARIDKLKYDFMLEVQRPPQTFSEAGSMVLAAMRAAVQEERARHAAEVERLKMDLNECRARLVSRRESFRELNSEKSGGL